MAITLIKPADTVSVEQGFHDHNTNMDTIASEVLLADGSTELTAPWDAGTYNYIKLPNWLATYLIAIDASGIYIFDKDLNPAVFIQDGGNVGIKTYTPGAAFAVNGGANIGADADPGDNNLYVVGDCSALTFTDRTPFFEGDALKEIRNIKRKDGMIDHDTIPEFSKSVISLKKPITKDVEKLIKDEKKTVKEIIGYEDIQEIGRNLSGMVSMLTKAIQQLTERIEKLEEKLNG